MIGFLFRRKRHLLTKYDTKISQIKFWKLFEMIVNFTFLQYSKKKSFSYKI